MNRDYQRLVFKGLLLKNDDTTLKAIGLNDGGRSLIRLSINAFIDFLVVYPSVKNKPQPELLAPVILKDRNTSKTPATAIATSTPIPTVTPATNTLSFSDFLEKAPKKKEKAKEEIEESNEAASPKKIEPPSPVPAANAPQNAVASSSAPKPVQSLSADTVSEVR